MYKLQSALDERLAALIKRKTKLNQSINNKYTSKSYIERSLKEAGILSKKGKMLKKVAA